MKPKKIIAIMAVTMWGLFLWLVPANAKLITIEIEAEVDFVDDDLGVLEGKINVGDIISGWYTYDTSTPDSVPSYPNVGRYEHHTPPCGISLTVGGFDFKTDPANIDFLAGIGNDITSGGLHDSYWIYSYNNLCLSNGEPVDDVFWSLRDYSAAALSSADLGTTPVVLDNWESNIIGIGADRKYAIWGHVSSAIMKAFCGDPNHPYPVGDLNQDCRVDLLDLAILASHWLEDNTPVNSNSVVKDGIEYYIQTDKFVYQMPQDVEILFRVTNLTENPVDIGKVPNCEYAWTHFVVTDSNSTEIWEYIRGIPPCGWTMLHLDPHKCKEYQKTWNMMNDNGTWTKDDDFPIGPGLYNIMGQLRLSNAYRDKKVPVSVHIKIIQ